MKPLGLKKTFSSTVIFLILILCFPSSAWAVSYIYGNVLDQFSQPINHAKVDSGTGVISYSLSDGWYLLAVPWGNYTVTVTAPGYQRAQASVAVPIDPFGNPVPVLQNFNLSPATLKLAAVYPTLGVLGSDLPATLTGTGFDASTRISMYLDSGNLRAVVGEVPPMGSGTFPVDVAVSGKYAYLVDTNSNGGLRVIDISDSTLPAVVGNKVTPGWAVGVAVSGNYAYVADRAEGLQVIDVSNPTIPQILNGTDTGGYALDVAISGNYAFIAADDAGLRIVDVSTPSMPVLLPIGVVTSGNALRVVVAGDYAYVADGDSVEVIDISNPTTPVFVRAVTGGSYLYAKDVAVKGGTLFAVHGGGLRLFDIGSDPGNPQWLSNAGIRHSGLGVAIAGDYAYVADSGAGLSVIDIADRQAPFLVGSFSAGYARSVAVADQYGYVASNEGMRIVKLTPPPAPPAMVAAEPNVYTIENVEIEGDYAYVGFHDFKVVDIHDPENPTKIATLNPTGSGNIEGIALRNGYAYLACGTSGLQVVNYGNPEAPVLLPTQVPIAGQAFSSAFSGDHAFVASSFPGAVTTIDLSNPAVPVATGGSVTTTSARDIAVSGSWAYVADCTDGIRAIDISTPAAPVTGSPVATSRGGCAQGIAVADGYAYVMDTYGMSVFNLSLTPATPQLVAYVETPGWAHEVRVSGERAYVADGYAGVHVFDISTPSAPISLGYVDTPGRADDVAVSGDLAFVADLNKGLTVIPLPIEVSPPTKTVDSESQISLSPIPSPPMAGHYILRVFNENESHELTGALSFVLPDDDRVLKSKAIIVAGGGPNAGGYIWEETKAAANKAYDVLIQQGFDHDSIYYLSMEIDNPAVDQASLGMFLQDAITNWAGDGATSELLVYLVDHGDIDKFLMFEDEDAGFVHELSAQELDTWLDDLQNPQDGMAGLVTVIYDACQSGTFVRWLRPPTGRIRNVITSTSREPAYFLDGGQESFSFQFWDSILLENGNLGAAFSAAANLMRTYQTPLLDADGDGIPNEVDDYAEAQTSILKAGKPASVSVKPYVGAAGVSGTHIWASDVKDADSVSARIVPPDVSPNDTDTPITSLPQITLEDPDNDGVYEGLYSSGFSKAGTYIVSVRTTAAEEIYSYAAGASVWQDFFSPYVYTSVTFDAGDQTIEPDAFDIEGDDSPAQAQVILANDVNAQAHNFHSKGDEDWVQFYCIGNQAYYIKAGNPSIVCDVALRVCNGDGSCPDPEINDTGAGQEETAEWTCPADGVYRVQARNAGNTFGETVRYDLSVYRPIGGTGTVVGKVTDQQGNPIDDVTITSSLGGFSVLSHGGGWYIIDMVSGNQTLTATKQDYAPQYLDVTVADGAHLREQNFVMSPPDTTPPSATINYSTTAPTNQPVVATITLSDINAVAITSQGGDAHTFTQEGSHSHVFTFVDAAGNSGSATATVDWIDKTAPTYAIFYSPDVATNQDVSATITMSDVNTVTVTGGATHVFSANGTYTFSFMDAAGNTGTAVAAVNWIDKTPPTGTVVYSPDGLTNENVTATLKVVGETVAVNSEGGASHVFTANGTHTFLFTDAAGNEGSVLANVDWIDKMPPTASIAYSTTDPTNQNVTATITVTGGAVTSGSSSYVFSTNGTYLFTFADEAGNTDSALAVVDWIDTAPPSASVSYSTTSLANQDVTATLSLSDANDVTVTSAGGTEHTFGSNGSFTFVFKDAAGNTGTAVATVNWIDKTPPTATVAYSATSLTNQDVTATLQPSEAVVVTNNGGAAAKTFTTNDSFTFTFEDAAGNTGSATATVNWIDKTPSTYTIAYAPATLTNQNVTATITLSDGTVTSAGGGTHTFTENGTYVFTFADAAGNNGTATATVDWIDTAPPIATISYSTTSVTNQNVTATITLNDTGGTVTRPAEGNTHTFSENGSFTFEFIDSAGNIATAVAAVNWIDKMLPTAMVSYSNTASTNQSVLAVLAPSEAVTLTNNGGAATRLFTANGSFTFTFVDPAGNTGSATATVNNIDKTPPTYTISYAPDALTNQNVTATLNLSDGTVTSDGGATYAFTENGPFTFVFTDAAGNTGTALAMVYWIDKTPPAATVAYNTTEPTTHDVVATLIPAEAVVVNNNGGSTQRMFTENGSFAFQFTDAAGNAGTATAVVDNIYLSDPVVLLGNAPSGIETVNAFSITVGGEDVDRYRYRLNLESYGPVTVVGMPINLSGIRNGGHTLRVIGGNAADAWQPESEATIISWEVVCRGNINGDEEVNLADAIIGLKVLSSKQNPGQLRSDYGSSGADTDGGNKVGVEEVMFILQKEAGLR